MPNGYTDCTNTLLSGNRIIGAFHITSTPTTAVNYQRVYSNPVRDINLPGLYNMEWEAQRIERQRCQIAGHSAEAKERSRQLLMGALSEEQRKTFEEDGFFYVCNEYGKRYRIRMSDTLIANIDVMTTHDRVGYRLCAHCDLSLIPIYDQLLAQKTWIEVDWAAFELQANYHPAR